MKRFFLFLLALPFRNGPPPADQRWSLYAHHLGDYMHRWILRTPWGTLRLHHILRSDDDRHLHDHPFDFTSFLLTAAYTEVIGHVVGAGVLGGTVEKIWPRFSIVRKRAEDPHRLVLHRPVWTFVISGPKRRAWGFYTPKGWIHHVRYLDLYPEVVVDRVGGSHADLVRLRELQAEETAAERHRAETGHA